MFYNLEPYVGMVLITIKIELERHKATKEKYR